MKKIINNPSDFVDESIDGLIKSHPEIYSLAKDNSRVITRASKSSKIAWKQRHQEDNCHENQRVRSWVEGEKHLHASLLDWQSKDWHEFLHGC